MKLRKRLIFLEVRYRKNGFSLFVFWFGVIFKVYLVKGYLDILLRGLCVWVVINIRGFFFFGN